MAEAPKTGSNKIRKEKRVTSFLSQPKIIPIAIVAPEQGILKKYNIKVLGTSPDTIRITEDRKLFNQQLAELV